MMTEPDITISDATPIPVPVPTAPPAFDVNSDERSDQMHTYGREPGRRELNEAAYRALSEQGFTRGLSEALVKNNYCFAKSFWVVDNSGSMAHRDGHRFVETKNKHDVKLAPCTRWAEMQQTVDYHVQMAALLLSPTTFRLLNDPGRNCGPQQFSVCERGDSHVDEDIALAQSTMSNASPGGVTPLVPHLREVRQNIAAMEPQLRANGTKVAVVLATDGLPSNDRGISDHAVQREFLNSLRSLEGLPVWIVVRLCTDDDGVVDYWNGIDEQLELSIEVLDDFTTEAEEINKCNKWLNYGLPLHRMRELGFNDRLFDLLDERKFIKDELRDFCAILFGEGKMDGVPDPEADWDGFVSSIETLLSEEQPTWNPRTRRIEPWINMRQLQRDYSSSFFWFLW